GETVSLADFKGRKLGLYLYPKADTPGCTREALDFSRLRRRFDAAATDSLGVSADPVQSQRAFKIKHKLRVDFASDETHAMLTAYGVWGEKILCGRRYMGVTRSTFLIDRDGRIARIWSKVKV